MVGHAHRSDALPQALKQLPQHDRRRRVALKDIRHAFDHAPEDCVARFIQGAERDVAPVSIGATRGAEELVDHLGERGEGPLNTFSGVHSDPAVCAETRAIHAVCRAGDLKPHLIDHGALEGLQPQLDEASWSLDEPFDVTMALLRCLYMTAQRQGVRAVLDGAGSDVVLNDGTHIIRQFRRGHWVTAWREATCDERS